jgi:hypothetical protein
MWRIWRPPNNASKWQMKFNMAFKGLKVMAKTRIVQIISNVVLCFLLGNSPASEFYMPTFRNTLFYLYRRIDMKDDWVWKCWSIYTWKGLDQKFSSIYRWKGLAQKLSSQTFFRKNTPTFSNLIILHTHPLMKMEQSVPKRRYIKFRGLEITQRKHTTFRTGRKFEINYIKCSCGLTFSYVKPFLLYLYK